MISVAMTTYNCARFVEDQMDSIFNQTMRPDEVVIVDDGSTDETRSIVERFISRHGLEQSWHYRINASNLGWRKNFYVAANLTHGDFILFSDHDDIWDARKIEILYEALNQSNSEMLISDYILVGADGVTPLFPEQAKEGSGEIQPIELREFFNWFQGGGAACILRRELFQRCRSFLQLHELPHDLTLAANASARGALCKLDVPLLFRRVHDANESVPAKKGIFASNPGDLARRISLREEMATIASGITELNSDHLSAADADAILDFAKRMRARSAALRARKPLPLVADLFSSNKLINKKWVFSDMKSLMVGK